MTKNFQLIIQNFSSSSLFQVGGESVETVLTVTAPLSAEVEPKVQTIDFGRPAIFTCRFSGNPIKTMRWMKNGKFIEHTDAILRIEAVKKEDKGMYQCVIKNDQESAQATAELKLGGRCELRGKFQLIDQKFPIN